MSRLSLQNLPGAGQVTPFVCEPAKRPRLRRPVGSRALLRGASFATVGQANRPGRPRVPRACGAAAMPHRCATPAGSSAHLLKSPRLVVGALALSEQPAKFSAFARRWRGTSPRTGAASRAPPNYGDRVGKLGARRAGCPAAGCSRSRRLRPATPGAALPGWLWDLLREREMEQRLGTATDPCRH